MSNSSLFTVLVNTSDGFEDCWDPFFTLYRRYWPAAQEPVLLNTETKVYRRDDMAISCAQVQGKSEQRGTWSACLLAALDQVQTPLVLYFQEDYFIDHPVLDSKVRAAADYMHANTEVKHIALTGIGSQGPHEDYPDTGYSQIRRNTRYRISTQAALWRTESLKSYLVSDENGWMFEIYGTMRARKRNECFLCADFGPASGGPAIQYRHTGIIKGKWLPAIQQVFEANAISVNYSERGFYQAKGPLLRKLETSRKLLSRPGHLLRNLIFNR